VVTQNKEAIMNSLSWGKRFTHIQVKGIDKTFCKKLADGAATRLALVSFLNDAYLPFLNDGVGTPVEPATRPLQCVYLTVEFFKGSNHLDSFELGSQRKSMAAQNRFETYPSLIEKRYPTAAQISQHTFDHIIFEQNSHNKEVINALVLRWGKDLTCRLEFALPGGGRAPGIFYFMPGNRAKISLTCLNRYLPVSHSSLVYVTRARARPLLPGQAR